MVTSRAKEILGSQVCSGCGEDKPLAEYTISPPRKGRKSPRVAASCRVCQRMKARERRARPGYVRRDGERDHKRDGALRRLGRMFERAAEHGPVLPDDPHYQAYLRGLWVGWQRGLDSHVKWGPSLGNIVMCVLSRGLSWTRLTDEEKAEVYAKCSDVPLEEYEHLALLKDAPR